MGPKQDKNHTGETLNPVAPCPELRGHSDVSSQGPRCPCLCCLQLLWPAPWAGYVHCLQCPLADIPHHLCLHPLGSPLQLWLYLFMWGLIVSKLSVMAVWQEREEGRKGRREWEERIVISQTPFLQIPLYTSGKHPPWPGRHLCGHFLTPW